MASVTELPAVPVMNHGSIRVFKMTLNDVSIELSSLGASITKILLPDYSAAAEGTLDDVVLSYCSPKEQYEDQNKAFFGTIVGRVANRIKDGRFQVLNYANTDDVAPHETLDSYELEKNNGTNHLHGGSNGFWNMRWDADVVKNGLQFTLVSSDGDQGYPGRIRAQVTYLLLASNNGPVGAKISVDMTAKLLDGETKATPVALAQHSYFNLASHSSSTRILDHTLHMPNCNKYTPVDRTSIPTRAVDAVDLPGTKAMDFRKEKNLAEAMIQYGSEKAGLERNEALTNVLGILNSSNGGDKEHVARTPEAGSIHLDGSSPYGFDHNYVIGDCKPSSGKRSLHLAAVLSHPPTRRELRVSTTAPGVQLYTSNYLDGKTPHPSLCKDGVSYPQWQGLCLETQTYPDSIYSGADEDGACGEGEFAEGKCFILRPGGDHYYHAIEYEFGRIMSE